MTADSLHQITNEDNMVSTTHSPPQQKAAPGRAAGDTRKDQSLVDNRSITRNPSIPQPPDNVRNPRPTSPALPAESKAATVQLTLLPECPTVPVDGKDRIELILVRRSDSVYQAIRDQHYVPNHGTIGRQLHYVIRLNDVTVGIITGASAVWAVKPRDEFFGITPQNREEVVGRNIVNNTVSRLEVRQKNLGTQVLSRWRKQVQADWLTYYGDKIAGFETFIYGEGRTGAMYKADNWSLVGETQGNTKFHANGTYGGTERRETERKLIFCKRIARLFAAASPEARDDR